MTFEIKKITPFGVLLESCHSRNDIRDLRVEDLREMFESEQIIVLRGFRGLSSSDDFAGYCERFGEICVWPFGKVLELVEHENPSDHIFDHNYVPLHWDGMYRPQVPEYQIFQCVAAPLSNQGGRTLFSNTKLMLNQVSKEKFDLWKRVSGRYQREMEYYNSETLAPVIIKHPIKSYPVVRFCESTSEGDASFVNHAKIEYLNCPAGGQSSFRSGILEELYSPKFLYAHEWQVGDVVIADNYTLLHGREAFISGVNRHLRRVHVLGNPPLINPHLVSFS